MIHADECESTPSGFNQSPNQSPSQSTAEDGNITHLDKYARRSTETLNVSELNDMDSCRAATIMSRIDCLSTISASLAIGILLIACCLHDSELKRSSSTLALGSDLANQRFLSGDSQTFRRVAYPYRDRSVNGS